jgi:hypothetical protein
MSSWRAAEVYATFMKLSGELEVRPSERFSDAVRRQGDWLQLRNTQARPLSSHYPLEAGAEPTTTVARSATILVVPADRGHETTAARHEQREAHPVVINTVAFSLVARLHLEPRRTLQDHLERFAQHWLPVTEVVALWVAGSAEQEQHPLQLPFALLNPAAILSHSPRA